MRIFKPHKYQVKIEEMGNASTHLLGALSAILGFVLLSMVASQSDSVVKWVSSVVFSISLVLMFSASTFYHLANDPELKRKLKILDHCTIFFLIAGTYTPFMLIALHSMGSYLLLSIIWILALSGTVFKLFYVYHYPKLSTFFYLAMGWLAIFALNPLYHHLSHDGFYWLVAGGLCYTVGVIFYSWKRLYFSHAIWHLFVMGGCACHFWAIYRYVMPL